jgi:hypothetical protein
MAGDWIKMRVDLQSHPKVVRILSAIKSDKFRVLGGLHAVWSVFDTHSIDGELHGYTPDALDHVIGWPGFAAAMMTVKWLAWDGAETLTLPEFGEHNGQSAKRRAEDQKRKRDGRKSPPLVRNLSADDADAKRTREEKRREEEKQKKDAPVGAANDDELFEGVDPQVVADFKALRKAKKSTITATAIAGIKREAEKAGLTLESALRICCERGWAGFSASWQGIPAATPPSQPGGGRRAL